LLCSFGFCDNGDFLDEGFITALFSLEWLAGTFLHLRECHFHMVRNGVAKLEKTNHTKSPQNPNILGFVTNRLLFVLRRRPKQKQ